MSRLLCCCFERCWSRFTPGIDAAPGMVSTARSEAAGKQSCGSGWADSTAEMKLEKQARVYMLLIGS